MPQNPNLFNIDFTKFMPQNPYDQGAMDSSVMSDRESDDVNPVQSALTQQQGYRPQHQFIDMLAEAIKSFPQRNQPSRMQNIMGTIAGLGAGVGPSGHGPAGEPLGFKGGSPNEIFQAQDMVRYRPYYQQLQDWEAKLKPMQMGASDERYQNINERMFLNDIARNMDRSRRTDIYGDTSQARATHWENQDELGINRLDWQKDFGEKKLAIEKAKSQAQGGVVKSDRSGAMYIIGKDGTPKPVMYNGQQLRASSDAEKSALILGRMSAGIAQRGRVEEGLIDKRLDARKTFWDWMVKNPTAMQDRAGMRNRINAAVAGNPALGQYFDLEQGIPKPDALANIDDPNTLYEIFNIVGGKPGSMVTPTDTGPNGLTPVTPTTVRPAPGRDVPLPTPPKKTGGTEQQDWRDDPNQQIIVEGVGPNNKGQRARIRKGTEGGMNPALWRVVQ